MAEPSPAMASDLNQLQGKVDRLSSLIDVGAIISSSLDVEEVIRLVMQKAQTVMEAETCSILLLNEEMNTLEFELALDSDGETEQTLKEKVRLQMGQGVAGWCAQERRSVLVADVRQDERFFIGADEATGFVTRSLMAVPLINKDQLIGVAEVINPTNKETFDESDLELFETFCRQVAIALSNARYHQAYLAQQRLKEQLAIAASIQENFLPRPLPDEAHCPYHLEAVTFPALEVGGDLYDFFLLPGNRLAVLIGDVSGKGVAAAIYMARVVSEFRFLARLLPDPAAVMSRLNQSLSSGNQLGMFVTAVYWLVNLSHGVVTFCNAGHLPSIWRRRGRRSIQMVREIGGLPLGVLGNAEYVSHRLSFEPGDSLVMITDGVIEAWNKDKEQYGFERLTKLIQAAEADSSVVARVVSAVRRHCRGEPSHDDLTMVEVAWSGADEKWAPQAACPTDGEEPVETIELDTSLDPRMLRVVRDVARRTAVLGGMDKEEADAFRLAVDEACTNVLRHAYGGDTTRRLRINFYLGPDRLVVELHDFGAGFDPEAVPPLDHRKLKPGGLGFHLIRSVMDQLDYVHSETMGNTFKLTKYLSGRRRAGEH